MPDLDAEGRVPCINLKCGHTILPSTFLRTNGLCMPCAQGKGPETRSAGPTVVSSYQAENDPKYRLFKRIIGASSRDANNLFLIDAYEQKGAKSAAQIEYVEGPKGGEPYSFAQVHTSDLWQKFSSPGWLLLGQFPGGGHNQVASWLLHNKGQAVLLGLPKGLTAKRVADALDQTGTELVRIEVSHLSRDYFDADAFSDVRNSFPRAIFPEGYCYSETPYSCPEYRHDQIFTLGGEPLFIINFSELTFWDTITVFRGIAMTGNLNLGHVWIPKWHLDYFLYYTVSTIFNGRLTDQRDGKDFLGLLGNREMVK